MMSLSSLQSLVIAAMRKERICKFLFVLGLIGNHGQSCIGSTTTIPDKEVKSEGIKEK